MIRWKQLHAINELRREEQFQHLQNAHSEAFTSMGQQHALEFEESQNKREAEFGTNEQRRAIEFNREQEMREAHFKEAQDWRDTQFSRIMDDLLVTARKDEMEREEKFAGWELSVQARYMSALEQWKREFTGSEERKRRAEARLTCLMGRESAPTPGAGDVMDPQVVSVETNQ